MIQNVILEVSELWNWVVGLVAGLSFAMLVVIAFVAYVVVSLARINSKLTKLENRVIVEGRDLSLRMNRVESDGK